MRELFEQCISEKIMNMNDEYIELVSGDIHREVGGYPGNSHRMPTCCAVMYGMMKGTDKVIYCPPKGKGATVRIRYYRNNHKQSL